MCDHDLFGALDESYRRRLRAAGWYECAGFIRGRLMWRSPAGAVLDEPEAIRHAETLPPAPGDADG